ncbi:hypothetical protein HMPREF0495_00219 [Levilactobacillus brevis ATCC 14869 = DSM 20054]|uniref:Uncharacterized protein n=1 Tax=Levilactobacillus brevis ATCC 14869 = DSM 20054 TaxID=649758 RepID=U2PNW3_LEVBR|nr:hypothetical protein HMPREF0495_00219 [Levilactobacillus brevis ATCC 14869 = DSM 20054]
MTIVPRKGGERGFLAMVLRFLGSFRENVRLWSKNHHIFGRI